MLSSHIRHHTLRPIQRLSGLLICPAVTSNLFCPGQYLYRFYLLRSKKLTIYLPYESEVVKLLASII